MRILTLILLIFISFQSINSLRILGIFPHVGKSHFFIFKPLLRALAEKGHEVTVISHFPLEEKIPNYKDINLSGSMKKWFNFLTVDIFDFYIPFLRYLRHINTIFVLSDIGFQCCKTMIENEEVQNITRGQYDVVLIEQFNSDCGLAIVHKLDVPSIGVTTHALMSYTNDRIGALDNPSFMPSHHLEYGTKPSLLETLETLLVNIFYKIAFRYTIQIPEHNFLKKYYGDDLPDLEDLGRNLSMIFVNSYFPLSGALPLAPNIAEIGGIHLHYSDTNKLPEDLQNYLDNSKNGVILFSMGSMVVGSSWPEKRLKAFQNVFRKIPYDVLWKWENDSMAGKPENVKVVKWLPQYNVLNHKNVKGFISHGGMLSLTEAIQCGVPIVTIPLYGDQFHNAGVAEELEFGVYLELQNITEISVKWAIEKILIEKSQTKAKLLSKIWKDRLVSPMETAIYWIEHVARYGGKHLKSPVADISWIRYYLIDVFAVLLFFIIFISYISYKITTLLLTKLNAGKQKDD